MEELETQMATQAATAAGTGIASTIGNIGGSLLNGLTGGVSGLVSQGLGALGNEIFGTTQADKDAEQLKQQEALQQQQIAGSEQLTDFNRDSQLEYQQAQYAAQIAGMNEAGLNPAMMYGAGAGNGGGGTVVQVQGGQAADTAQITNAETAQKAQAAQAGMQASQEGVNDADINKINAEVPNINAGTINVETQTGLLSQQTHNAQIAADGMEFQNTITRIQSEIAQSTETASEATVQNNLVNLGLTTQKISAELTQMLVETKIKQQTATAVINNINAQVEQTMVNIIKTKSEGRLNDVQATTLAQKISQGQQQLLLEARGQDVSKENTATMAGAILKSAMIGAAAQTVTTAANALIRKPTQVHNATNYIERPTTVPATNTVVNP